MKKRDYLLSDKVYEVLNVCAVVIFPALGTLYFALAQIWGLPAAEQMIGSIVAFDTFLGVIVKVGERSYDQSTAKFGGALEVRQEDGKKVYTINLEQHPNDLQNRQNVLLQVQYK